eukprot:1131741-Prymnesium_polylepis.2
MAGARGVLSSSSASRSTARSPARTSTAPDRWSCSSRGGGRKPRPGQVPSRDRWSCSSRGGGRKPRPGQ